MTTTDTIVIVAAGVEFSAFVVTCALMLRSVWAAERRSKAFDAELRAHLDESRERLAAMSVEIVEIRPPSQPNERN